MERSTSVGQSCSSFYPTWAKGLKKTGLYYDGFVDDIESVLEQHRKETVTFYDTRSSSGAELDKENNNDSLDNEVFLILGCKL